MDAKFNLDSNILSPLIIPFEADKWEFIDNNHIVKIHCQNRRFEESINHKSWLSPLNISFLADQCECIENNRIIKLISKLSLWRSWLIKINPCLSSSHLIHFCSPPSDSWVCINNNYITQINCRIIPFAQLINTNVFGCLAENVFQFFAPVTHLNLQYLTKFLIRKIWDDQLLCLSEPIVRLLTNKSGDSVKGCKLAHNLERFS